MCCHNLIPLRVIIVALVVHSVEIQAQHVGAIGVPITRVSGPSLWQPTVDICQDPVHGGLHLNSNSDLDIGDAVWEEFGIKMQVFRHTLLQHIIRLESTICQSDLELLRNYSLHDVVQVEDVTTGVSQSPGVQIYRDVSKMAYLFSVLNSDGARLCCLDNHVVFSKLRNQILPEVYNMISGAVLNWPIRSCTLSVRTRLGDHVTCGEIRSLILLLYRYGLNQSVHILQDLH